MYYERNFQYILECTELCILQWTPALSSSTILIWIITKLILFRHAIHIPVHDSYAYWYYNRRILIHVGFKSQLPYINHYPNPNPNPNPNSNQNLTLTLTLSHAMLYILLSGHDPDTVYTILTEDYSIEKLFLIFVFVYSYIITGKVVVFNIIF